MGKAAKKAKRYIAEHPCRQCGDPERYASNDCCVTCQSRAVRDWRDKKIESGDDPRSEETPANRWKDKQMKAMAKVWYDNVSFISM